MIRDIKEYFTTLGLLLSKVISTDRDGRKYPFEKAIVDAIRMIINQTSTGGKLIFIGNGGSAAIASHIAIDFWKNAGVRALAFNDSSLLTCISNDYGYEYVFEKPIEMFIESKDILVAISSSGNSENILNGTAAAKKKGAKVLTLSGFSQENQLSKLGDFNFYVPASQYGYVELIHASICHCLVDFVMKTKK